MLRFKQLPLEDQNVIYTKSEIQYNVTHLNTLLHHLFTRVKDISILNDSNILIDTFVNNLHSLILTNYERKNKEDID